MAAGSLRPGVGLRQQGWSLAMLPRRTPPPPCRVFASACVGPFVAAADKTAAKICSGAAVADDKHEPSCCPLHWDNRNGELKPPQYCRPVTEDGACAAQIQVLETEPGKGGRVTQLVCCKMKCRWLQTCLSLPGVSNLHVVLYILIQTSANKICSRMRSKSGDTRWTNMMRSLKLWPAAVLWQSWWTAPL